MIQFWVIKRYLFSKKVFFSATSLFSVFGLALGVACLVVAMSVVSGYEKTLKSALTDFAAHVTVYKRGAPISQKEAFLADLPEMIKGYKAYTPFVQIEGMVAHKGRIAGVLVEGLDQNEVHKVLNLKHRIQSGEFSLGKVDDAEDVVVGSGVAKNFSLKVGDSFRFIRPVGAASESVRMRTKMQKFRVGGIIDLGKVEYNDRLILSGLTVAQKLRESEDAFTGLKILIENRDLAPHVAINLGTDLGYPYVVRDWMMLNKNLLEAIRLEKPVIFFVILVMVIAACFNVCSHLLVDVLRKYSDVSVLRTLGASKKSLMVLFSLQGMFVGLAGTLLGVALGTFLAFLFVWAQKAFGFIPGETYKLAHIGVQLRPSDLILVIAATMGICFLSTLPAAFRGARLNPVEGLKYE